MGLELMQGGSAAGSTASSAQQLSSLPLDGSVVKLRGLPFRASVDDVLKFFVSFPELGACNIYFKRHPDGRPSGEVRHGCFRYRQKDICISGPGWRDVLTSLRPPAPSTFSR